MHSDRTSIQLRDHLRATLADMMAAYERQHGPVETIPLICGPSRTFYNGRDVEAEHATARARSAAKQRKPKTEPKRGTRKARDAAVLREVWP